MTLTKKLIISLLTTFIGCLVAGAANNKPALMWIDGEIISFRVSVMGIFL